MSPSDLIRLQLRPIVPVQSTGAPDERFMHETLRPVLKLQNSILLVLMRSYLSRRKVVLTSFSLNDRERKIKEILRKDIRFRALLLGVVIGQFTESELDEYTQHEAELNKRIAALLFERFRSQMNDIIGEHL